AHRDLQSFPTRRSSDLEEDVIQKSGSWYSYNGERLGQGRENSKQFLKEHPEIRKEIAGKIREAYGLNGPQIAAPEEEESEDEILDRKSTRLNSSHVKIS